MTQAARRGLTALFRRTTHAPPQGAGFHLGFDRARVGVEGNTRRLVGDSERRATLHRPQVRETGMAGPPAGFIPLDAETRTHVPTSILCWHIGRQQQTARGWASAQTYPPELTPFRVFGRLMWSVRGIRAVLGVA